MELILIELDTPIAKGTIIISKIVIQCNYSIFKNKITMKGRFRKRKKGWGRKNGNKKHMYSLILSEKGTFIAKAWSLTL